jgi:bifunctional UDP-N-acetylglucosamine pyrophosphorylase/glucosamine-1-phosphate N-acetyltransferase
MKSGTPKVLHRIFDKPLLAYCLEALDKLKPDRIVVVTNSDGRIAEGSGAEGVKADVKFALQREQHGTAQALLSGVPALKGFRGTVLVTNGDTPLITPETLRRFVSAHRKAKRHVSMLSFRAADPTGYGRILRGSRGEALRVVEEGDASEDEKCIDEVNSGTYAIEASALPLLKKIKVNGRKGEYYLTDIVELALGSGRSVGVYCLGQESEFLGVNSREHLSAAIEAIRSRTIGSLLKSGVTFVDPLTAFIGPDVKVGQDTVIWPNVYLHGMTVIGSGCVIMPGTRIEGSTIADGAVIKDSCVIEGSKVGAGAQVGPFAHLRPGSDVGAGARVGNFVETKKAQIGPGAKVSHLSYIGDATVGRDVNIGAGTITCNYDGKKKHRTVICDGVFIGSDTQLVAPVTVGEGAYVAAGSTITKDVAPGALALSRTKQREIAGYVRKKASRQGGEK